MTRIVPLADLLLDMTNVSAVGDVRVPINGITLDSRRVGPGFLFAALRGERTDGLDFLGDALSRGAAAVLSDRPRPDGVACSWALAQNPRSALAEVARSFFGNPDEHIPVVGITGTNGKTTVAYLLEAIVDAAGGSPGVLGTVSYRIAGAGVAASRTTPEADALYEYLRKMVDAGCSHALLEVSSHALALERVHGLRFAAGVFTNLTRDHLDFHGTMDAYLEAKSRLFRTLEPTALAVLNADDPASARLAALTRARVVTFGAGEKSNFRMSNVRSSFDGVRFQLVVPGSAPSPLDVVSPLPGLPNASNIAAALATALSMEIDADAALRGVRSFRGAPGRFERIDRGQDFHVIVDYAHTDDALTRLLAAIRALGPVRITTVFGCGGDRDRTKRPLMGVAAAEGSDEVILTSDNPRREDPEKILDDVEVGVLSVAGAAGRYRRIVDRREAIAAAIALAGPGDTVVIAGKGHEEHQILGDRTVPFDDRLVAAECLDLRLGRK